MSNCTPCDNLYQALCTEKSYQYAILNTLCTILQTLQSSDTILTTNILDQVTKDAAEIEADYAAFTTIGLIDTTKKLNYIRVVNTSDVALEFSFDSGNTVAFTVLSGTTYIENLNITLSTTTALRMKKVTGETAGFGDVIIEGRYNT